MRRPDPFGALALGARRVARASDARWARRPRAGVALALALAAAGAAAADPAPLRFSAPIEVRTAAPFVQLALPPEAYARVERADLGDLRVVDGRGERVPFALLAPRSQLRASEQLREAVLYPLPARPTAPGVWPSPVDVVVDGDRISVHRRAASSASAPPPRESGGWLIVTGERRRDEAAARSLRLRWSGPAEFSAAYAIETSADLRDWQRAGAGQVMALQSASGALTQPLVPLPDGAGRFVRLVWAEPGSAPVVTGAVAVVPERHLVAEDAAREISVAASAEPAGRGAAAGDVDAGRRGLHFDLGAALPIVDVDLRFRAGTRVAPVRLQGRTRLDEPWRELGGAVFYRIERGAEVGEAPAVAVQATLRYLRVVADERAAALAGDEVRLVVHAPLASLVFASQGQPPYRLLAGSRDAAPGALPAATLVPSLDDERPRFGRAELGAFTVVEAAALEAERSERSARLRPWLLWAVLLVGVAVLGGLVWRLARSRPGDGAA